jgi:hypothetical protein
MDELIKSVPNNKGFKMVDSEIKIICYADNAVLLSDNKDDLQRMLFNFNKAAKNFNIKIANGNTKSMTIAKFPLRCKFMNDDWIIDQLLKIKYLGIDRTSQGLLQDKVKDQINKANTISGCLNDTAWNNKYISKRNKI